MRVAFVSSYPPNVCGVGDYTEQLEKQLQDQGNEVKVFHEESWPLNQLHRISESISSYKPHVVHIQYPTVTFGTSLLPHVLAWKLRRRGIPVVVTLHEFSQSHPLRKLASLLFGWVARRMIFTSTYELKAYQRWMPLIQSRASVIPIGSNIPFVAEQSGRDPLLVVYFGLIRPEKGIEEFIELARLAEIDDKPFRFLIMGSPQEKTRTYYEALRSQTAARPNLAWCSELTAKDIASILGTATYAYLPFPDGASERRGSLLAALGNEVMVITTQGEQTPKHFSEIVTFSASPEDALKRLNQLSDHPQQCEELRTRMKSMIKAYAWENIAKAHCDLYKSL